jgi:plasmid replication initiation protein
MKNQDLVVKANKLIEAKYNLSLAEQRVILAVISKIEKGDSDFMSYRFTVKEFADLLGLKTGNLYSRVREVVTGLLGKTIVIAESDGDLHVNWLSAVKYYEGQGKVDLSFDPHLKPYLLSLQKNFTRYQLKNVIRLRSVYSVRIYELLKQYQGVGSRVVSLDDLRGILSISENVYPLYANFRQKVLEKAKKDLVETDLAFEYKPVKTGRKITAVEFTIHANQETVKKSYKRTKAKKEPSLVKRPAADPDQEKERQEFKKIKVMKEKSPGDYHKLRKIAEKKMKADKDKPGFNLKVQFAMVDLLPGYLQKHDVKGI